MLVLERRPGESILVGDDIEITVVRVSGQKVFFGLTAPRDVSVHRKEVYEAIKAQNRAERRDGRRGGLET